jgi:broad specificity phosphatase PhoE
MLDAVHRARDRAAGHEAVCVSHQLPIWTLRRYLDQRRLWHDPRRRQCSLASLTSLVFADEALIEVVYTQPAGESDPKVAGA